MVTGAKVCLELAGISRCRSTQGLHRDNRHCWHSAAAGVEAKEEEEEEEEEKEEDFVSPPLLHCWQY